ncbi:MAG: hypothetical protein WCQ82_08555 [Bacteroidaceae bacterium]
MKKLFTSALVVLLFAYLLFSACDAKEQSNKVKKLPVKSTTINAKKQSDYLKKLHLKCAVKSITIKTYKVINKFGELSKGEKIKKSFSKYQVDTSRDIFEIADIDGYECNIICNRDGHPGIANFSRTLS